MGDGPDAELPVLTEPNELNGPALLRWGRICLDGLQQRRAEINALNVFPVADADTGTNMLATMRSAVQAAEAAVNSARGSERPAGGGLTADAERVQSDAETVDGFAMAVGSGGDAAISGPGAVGGCAADDGAVGDAGSSGAGASQQKFADRAIAANGVDRSPLPAPATRGTLRHIPVGGLWGGVAGGYFGLGGSLSAHAVAAAMARGATLGARGNSGIILSQVLRGIAEAARGGPLTARTLREALAMAAVLVRESLSVPVEGTILTVLERAAESAAACPESAVAAVAVAAADSAAEALGDTPAQLGVLREAGVVDAGARGLVVLLDSLVAVTLGETPTRPAYARGEFTFAGDQVGADHATAAAHADSAPRADAEPRSGGAEPPNSAAPHFEVMYLLSDTDDQRIAHLRGRLADLGDSVVVVGDGAGSWSAHVHCADAGAAVEAGIATGTLSAIRIESFTITARPTPTYPDATAHSGIAARADSAHPAQADGRHYVAPVDAADHAEAAPADNAGRADATAQPGHDGPADRAVVAVASGDGAAALFEAGGAVVLGGDGAVTSAALLTAIRQLPNREVLVLPNGALPAHELVAVGVAARDVHRDVLLLPSGSMVQGLAALAVHDCGRIAVDDAFAMSEAAAATRWGSVRAARERALTMVGTCAAGDGLGLVGHDVVVIDRDAPTAARTLLDRMLGFGGELVTLLVGAAAPAELADELAAHIANGFPGVEVSVYSGGQQADLVQIGVE
ncbi:DAK2 domain-containing protein [Nocardia sp. R16R-3T]